MGLAIDPTNPEAVYAAASGLITQAGFSNQFTLQAFPGGANNRVFRVEDNKKTALLKIYFQHVDDSRDRLGAEFSFARFAWTQGVRRLPEPLACDPVQRLGLYEFVSGQKLRADEISVEAIEQAIGFYHALNQHKDHNDAVSLPIASEACFTINDHLMTVERRLRRLGAIDIDSEINRKAVYFVRNDLLTTWKEVRQSIRQQIAALGWDLDSTLSQPDRCLSPSDFGFHNAICANDGNLRFIDFEYAGWDDPAKLVCDFFCQPAVPVSLSYFDTFAQSIASSLNVPEMHLRRFALLFPVYQIKWCCIMLNDFLPAGGARRNFAQSGIDQSQRKLAQLQKAQDALHAIQSRKS